MSTEFKVVENTGKHANRRLSFSSSCSSPGKQILQITQGFGNLLDADEPGFIQLSVQDAYRTLTILAEWLKMQTELEANRLSKEIEKNKELKKTVVQDAVKCQKFISDLEVLELPVRLLS